MSNIFNHNRRIFDIKLDKSDYWDFHLSLDNTSADYDNENGCLSAHIDFNDSECMWFDSFYSSSQYVWENAVNNGLELRSIGFTGIDNGLITYEKDAITNKDFLNLFLNSIYKIESDKKQLFIHKVDGNNQVFDYSNLIVMDEENLQTAKLNGGFFQGFFKSDNDYQVLPVVIDTQWRFSITLKPCDFDNPKYTINDKHPENKGMFLYIGTRAENKWYYKYLTEIETEECGSTYTEDDYLEKGYLYDNTIVNDDYLDPRTDENCDFVDSDYIEDGYFEKCENCQYIEDGYFEKDITISPDMKFTTEEGYDLYQPNIIEIKTDNKFITYHRGKDGLCANNDNEDTEVILYDIKAPHAENYFTLFNRTPGGYTTCNIQEYLDVKNKEYDVLADLYNNALGFQITDNGEVGFKYMVKDCENGGYKIESLYSKPNVVNKNEWNTIDIKLTNTRPRNPKYAKCAIPTTLKHTNKMKIQIYVNGKLVLVSKDLPMLNLRKLNDLDSKQQGVPFNISIGGGTQGLCDTVNINYMTPPTQVLPIEKEFCGSFIGYVKSFDFYTC